MADLTCERFAELLAAWAEGEVDPVERPAFEGHAAACPACGALARDYRAIPGLVRRATDARMPRRLAARLRRLAMALRRRGR